MARTGRSTRESRHAQVEIGLLWMLSDRDTTVVLGSNLLGSLMRALIVQAISQFVPTTAPILRSVKSYRFQKRALCPFIQASFLLA
jgi:hypothetical protein